MVTQADDVVAVLRPILGHPAERPAREPESGLHPGADRR